MTTMHTPGPWTHSGTARHCVIGKSAHGRKSVCVLQNTHDPEWEANARLIAAAPTMLDALREAHAILYAAAASGDDGVLPTLGVVASALYKATKS